MLLPFRGETLSCYEVRSRISKRSTGSEVLYLVKDYCKVEHKTCSDLDLETSL